MENVYSVKQVNAYIGSMFSNDFMLQKIYVRGEVSNCKYHHSGHIYFSLKDESAAISCIMFAGQRTGLSFHMRDGQQVVVSGSISVYERDGRYQLYAAGIRLSGSGELYERFEALKNELREMGMFSDEYKQPIPKWAMRIGIVTAPTGAAIQDIINVSARRNPYVQLILYPALVQGDGAAASIVKGISALDKEGLDVIIVGRGGGSIEDLWAFNEEPVARAIFECRTPVISAVGHETDTTIADYVADLRAPTPSAAAEMAVFDYRAYLNLVQGIRDRLCRGMRVRLEKEKHRAKQVSLRMQLSDPQYKIRNMRLRALDTERELNTIIERKLTDTRHKATIIFEKLQGLSPYGRLKQGYAYVETATGRNIRSVSQIKKGDLVSVCLSDGRFTARVEDTGRETGISGESL